MTNAPTSKQLAQEWFNLAQYEAASRFDALAWAKQIIKRVAIQEAFKQGNKATLDHLMEELIDAPLFNLLEKPYAHTPEAVANLSYATGPVVPLSHSDLERIQNLTEEFPKHTDSAIDEWSRRNDWLLALTRFGHLKIDLSARDKDILAAFQLWLASYRQATGIAAGKRPYRSIRTEEFQNWHDSKVLPYFDLNHWAKWAEVELTEDDKVELLFPDQPYRTRDSLRSLETKVSTVITRDNAIALSIA